MPNKLHTMTVLFAVTALFSLPALAEVRVHGGVDDVGYQTSFSGQPGGSLSYNGKKSKSTYMGANLGVSLITSGGGYFDISTSGGTGNHDLWASSGSASLPLRRNDATFTFGNSSINPYGRIISYYFGINSGTTEFGLPSGASDEFDTSGYFFGAGLAYPTTFGTVGVNAALVATDATWKNSSTGTTLKDPGNIVYNFGATAGYQFTHTAGMNVDYKLKINSYKFPVGYSGSTFSVKEQISSIGLKFYVKF